MSAAGAVTILELLDEAGIDAWLDGGWAVDAAIGRQRRLHDDLDLVVRRTDTDGLEEVLGRLGYERVRGAPPKCFELVDALGRQVDVHPVTFTAGGDGEYLMDNDESCVYLASGFACAGRILDHTVRCLTPEVQMRCHTGYEPHGASYDDVWALSEHFGLPVPEEYQSPRETYPVRRT
jgi:lincosamide nucleotidyltransferase A/C/D/E